MYPFWWSGLKLGYFYIRFMYQKIQSLNTQPNNMSLSIDYVKENPKLWDKEEPGVLSYDNKVGVDVIVVRCVDGVPGTCTIIM